MSDGYTLRADRVLAEGEERHGCYVTISKGVIAALGPSPPSGLPVFDLGSCDLVPGLVDLHSDCLELRARPRSSMELPLEAALLDLDAEVATSGITTHFVCVSIEDDLGKYRSLERAVQTVAAVERIATHLRVDHRLHLQVDVTGDGLDTAVTLAASPRVGLLSYMLHLPGWGQFPDEESWRRYYTTVEGEGEGLVQERLARRRARLGRVPEAQAELARLASSLALPLASHDDDSARSERGARALGVAISEFPVNAEAAAAAASAGLAIVMGAPNARQGASHHGNLSAREALLRGELSALASDYHPRSLLAAAYALSDELVCSWAEGLAVVTARPARAVRLGDRGVIRVGNRADLVAVGRRAGMPSVERTWVAGEEAFG